MVLFNAFGIYIHTYVQTHIYEFRSVIGAHELPAKVQNL